MNGGFYVVEDRMKAASDGKKTFYGKGCKVCGEQLRYTLNGGCVACQRRRAQERYEKVKRLINKAKNSRG